MIMLSLTMQHSILVMCVPQSDRIFSEQIDSDRIQLNITVNRMMEFF